MDIIRIIEQAERIVEEKGLDKSSLAKTLGFSSRYIADIKAGKSKNPGSDFILALINKLNFNPLWLETGSGEILSPQSSIEPKDETTPVEHYSKVPLLRQKVSCGYGTAWDDEQNIQEYIDLFSLIPRLKPRRLYAFVAQGTSMLGSGIQSGDYVIFDADTANFLNDDIYVFALDGEVYCKRLEFDKISKKIKIYSVRVADLEKAELLMALTIDDAGLADRFVLFGRVISWIHPNGYN